MHQLGAATTGLQYVAAKNLLYALSKRQDSMGFFSSCGALAEIAQWVHQMR